MENSNGAPGETTTPADAARRLKDTAATLVERGKEAADEQIEQGARRAAGSAHGVAAALRRVADEVEGEQGWIGSALRKSADGVDKATNSLGDGDVSRAMESLNGFARQQPAIFLGASLALGFALARVGKTAIERVSEENANPNPPISGM